MPLITPHLRVEEPEGSRSGGTNRVPSEILLEEVLPDNGPTTGGIPIAIFGESFPPTPLYVAFGNNWVRAVSHMRDCSSSYIDAKTYDRSGATPVLCGAVFLHLQFLVLWELPSHKPLTRMHPRLGGVWPLSSTKTLEPKREFVFWDAY